jgi:hypothetical protein
MHAAHGVTLACWELAGGLPSLVPVLDLANHAPTGGKVRPFRTGALRLLTAFDVPKGDEVFANYLSPDGQLPFGSDCNMALFARCVCACMLPPDVLSVLACALPSRPPLFPSHGKPFSPRAPCLVCV